ncbi:hypothetical protein [Mucilaginibacter boryungensis]|uniref:Outer membrane protein beta-barrel domain-containing protein n=1 Tax=Mucilaginibacter boryungensis TaxID=768480 RepID=A0ABR9XCF9_9SPHI|nr:hypothetical protein [Mucilaginibacter boryungensis]MBE9664852.1 hypothetical protein [Mucilaginibacter boryungensis]
MKKLFLLLVLLSGAVINASAQENSRTAFSIGPEMNLPSNSVYTFGYGGSAKIELPIVNRVGLSLTGGYTEMHYKSGLIGAFGPQPPSKFIPLKAGIQYIAGGGLYLEGEMGDVIETTGNKANLFTFSIGPGFLFRITPKQAIELGFRYEKWSKNVLTQTGIRVAYRLGW